MEGGRGGGRDRLILEVRIDEAVLAKGITLLEDPYCLASARHQHLPRSTLLGTHQIAGKGVLQSGIGARPRNPLGEGITQRRRRRRRRR